MSHCCVCVGVCGHTGGPHYCSSHQPTHTITGSWPPLINEERVRQIVREEITKLKMNSNECKFHGSISRDMASMEVRLLETIYDEITKLKIERAEEAQKISSDHIAAHIQFWHQDKITPKDALKKETVTITKENLANALNTCGIGVGYQWTPLCKELGFKDDEKKS